jgi:hypothetical protein
VCSRLVVILRGTVSEYLFFEELELTIKRR